MLRRHFNVTSVMKENGEGGGVLTWLIIASSEVDLKHSS